MNRSKCSAAAISLYGFTVINYLWVIHSNALSANRIGAGGDKGLNGSAEALELRYVFHRLSPYGIDRRSFHLIALSPPPPLGWDKLTLIPLSKKDHKYPHNLPFRNNPVFFQFFSYPLGIFLTIKGCRLLLPPPPTENNFQIPLGKFHPKRRGWILNWMAPVPINDARTRIWWKKLSASFEKATRNVQVNWWNKQARKEDVVFERHVRKGRFNTKIVV